MFSQARLGNAHDFICFRRPFGSGWNLSLVLLILLLAGTVARAQNPVPFISQPLFPQTLAPGGPSFVLTVNGLGFVSTSVVYWNGTALPTTYVNRGQLKAAVPASSIASQGTAWITVSSGGVSSNVAFFEITNAAAISFSYDFYPVGTGPVAAALGDFNNDGRLDLAVANKGGNSVSILLGNGEGTFQPGVSYPTGKGSNAVAVGDFNGDGKLDLAVTNYTDGTVSVLLGNGDGTFQSAVNYSVGNGPSWIVAADLNADGNLDLAVTDYLDGTINVLRGNGNGTFQAPTTRTVSGGTPNSIAVGDFEGIGRLDLVVTSYTGASLSQFDNDGAGNFNIEVVYSVGNNPTSVVAEDFNGDGHLDLAVVNLGDSTVSILQNSGNPLAIEIFQTTGTYSLGSGGLPTSVVATDLNGDGVVDLIVVDQGVGSLSALIGNGDGTFQPPALYALSPTVATPNSLVAGDFNGDGRIDLAVVNYGSNNLSILLQPTPPIAPPPPPTSPITDVTAGTGLSGGGTSGNVVLNNTGVLSLAAGTGITVSGGQTPTLSLNTAVTDARYLQLSGGTLSGGLFAPSFSGNGAGLTSLNPANLLAGLAGINISGNAATATSAVAAATATNALALGGILPAGFAPALGSPNYIQNGSSPAQSASINITGAASIGGNTSVTGNLATDGTFTIATTGTPITAHFSILVTPTFAAIKAGACTSTTFSLATAADGDAIALGVPTERMTTGGGQMLYTSWVSAPGIVTVRACNIGGVNEKTAGSGAIRIDLWKH